MQSFRSYVSLIILIAFFTLPTMSLAGTCGCDVSQRKIEAYNALLNLDPAEQIESTLTHLPWGIPATSTEATNEHLLYQTDYILNYDDDIRTSTWAAYRLRVEDVEVRRERTECFRNDPRLENADAATCNDYDEPVFDRGHIVPNADMTRDEAAMVNTYMFSNMVPQYANFNRIIWRRLEGYVRDWAEVKGEIYIVTGAIFDKDNDSQRDLDEQADYMNPTNRVAVPTHFYKIVCYERPNGYIESMTFLLPHDNEKHTGKEAVSYLKSTLTSIDQIEGLTGIDFMSVLGLEQPVKEAAVEASIAERMWVRK